MDRAVGEMGKRNRKSLCRAAGRLLALSWLLVAATCMIPVYAQRPDAPLPNGDTHAASADDPADPPSDANPDPESMLPHFKDTRFWLSGQANFIFQTHPDFHADYSGKNSLSPDYEKATSRVMTLYSGVRLNNSTEVLVDIEEAGGGTVVANRGLIRLIGADRGIWAAIPGS